MNLKNVLITVGVMLIFGAILTACGATPTPTAAPTEAPTEVPTAIVPDTPYLADWQGSGHADVTTEPFRHWDADDPAEVPTTCAKCHTSAGYQDYIGADGSEAGKVSKPTIL